MPNVDLLSDLHLDFYKDQAVAMIDAIVPTSETLVIAGDFSEAVHIEPEWILAFNRKYRTVLYVPGNHEYYRMSAKNDMRTYLHMKTMGTWTIMMNGPIASCNGFTAKGTTLWFPNRPDNALSERHWSDFNWIKHLKPWVYEEHERAKRYLVSEPQTDIWVVHHLPFWNCVHPKYQGADSNRYFVGDISRELWQCETSPKVILFGHTHEQTDMLFGDIRVVANPFGYPTENDGIIRPKLVEF